MDTCTWYGRCSCCAFSFPQGELLFRSESLLYICQDCDDFIGVEKSEKFLTSILEK